MAKIMIDLERIKNDPSLGELTWEIIEARGINTGDLAKLWELVLALSQEAVSLYIRSVEYKEASGYTEGGSILMYEANCYEALASFMARDARELVKFLDKRKFEFPEGYIGRYDGSGNDMGSVVQY